MSYAYCDKHKVSWDGVTRDYCLECMEKLEIEAGGRELKDDELWELGIPLKPIGNDDRHNDTY